MLTYNIKYGFYEDLSIAFASIYVKSPDYSNEMIAAHNFPILLFNIYTQGEASSINLFKNLGMCTCIIV